MTAPSNSTTGALIEEEGDHGPDKNRRDSIGYVWSGVELRES
jgi:hypothetical protein